MILFFINKTFSNLNTKVILICVDDNSCNDFNKCIGIKELTETRNLGIIFYKNLR